jgi:predicted nucleic acid-binding protein
MILILDVSAAMEIILKKEESEFFISKYKEAAWVIAPDLYVSEIANVLWKYHKAKIVSHELCQQYVEDGINLIDDYFESKELWKETLGEAIKNNHSVYDMFYAVLARRHDAILMTKDRRLFEVCKTMNIESLI